MKQPGIYRKLARVALATLTAVFTLPSLCGLVCWALGSPVPRVAPPRWVERAVAVAINGRAQALATQRGVRLAKPLTVRMVDKPRMLAAHAAATPKRTPTQLGDAAALLEKLGMLPAATIGARGVDNQVAPSRPGEVSGLYDLADGQLLVANWVDLQGGRLALDRDVAHAVLDRKFNLRRWLAPGTAQTAGAADTDGILSRHALIAGDATIQALEMAHPQGLLPPPRVMADIVAKTRANMVSEGAGESALDLARRLFVELDGLSFVAATRWRAPWTSVDAVWRRPPRSTEQILHPEKYDRNETPDGVRARLPRRFAGGWRIGYRDTLGELGVRTFLASAVGEYRADRAATGWGGDAALLLSGAASGAGTASPGGPGVTFAAWMTTWDDDTDADDFAEAAAQAMASLANAPATDARGPSPAASSGRSPAPSTPGTGRVGFPSTSPSASSRQGFRAIDRAGGIFMLERRRRTVGMLFAAPPAAARVLTELMSAVDKRPGGRPSSRVQGRARSR